MKQESRIFTITDFIRPSAGEPFRSVVFDTEYSSVVVWHVHPGQEIAAHIHPHGQDTWTVISGAAQYYHGNGIITQISTGDIAIAHPGQVHGALNSGTDDFVSVVASGNAGFALAEK